MLAQVISMHAMSSQYKPPLRVHVLDWRFSQLFPDPFPLLRNCPCHLLGRPAPICDSGGGAAGVRRVGPGLPLSAAAICRDQTGGPVF